MGCGRSCYGLLKIWLENMADPGIQIVVDPGVGCGRPWCGLKLILVWVVADLVMSCGVSCYGLWQIMLWVFKYLVREYGRSWNTSCGRSWCGLWWILEWVVVDLVVGCG